MQSSDRAFVACKNAAPVRGGVFIFAGSRHEKCFKPQSIVLLPSCDVRMSRHLILWKIDPPPAA
jgi:hypothetical protein